MNDHELDICRYGDMSDMAIVTAGGLGAIGASTTTASSITINATSGTITRRTTDSFLDEYIMNQYTIDHKVSEVEMLKLKEVKPDFAEDIKENIAKNLARDITKKVSYTKKKTPDSDTHHFIGRVWCFTTDELKQLIEDARNA